MESPPSSDLPPGWDQVAGRLGVENCLSLGGSSSKPLHWLPARQEQAEDPPWRPAPPVPTRDLQFLLPRDLGLEGLEELSAFPAFANRRILPELPRFPLLVARPASANQTPRSTGRPLQVLEPALPQRGAHTLPAVAPHKACVPVPGQRPVVEHSQPEETFGPVDRNMLALGVSIPGFLPNPIGLRMPARPWALLAHQHSHSQTLGSRRGRRWKPYSGPHQVVEPRFGKRLGRLPNAPLYRDYNVKH